MSEVLVVASKIKKYIKESSGLSTSATVMAALTGIIEEQCKKAVESAKSDNRKTVMDRDFQKHQ